MYEDRAQIWTRSSRNISHAWYPIPQSPATSFIAICNCRQSGMFKWWVSTLICRIWSYMVCIVWTELCTIINAFIRCLIFASRNNTTSSRQQLPFLTRDCCIVYSCIGRPDNEMRTSGTTNRIIIPLVLSC